MPHTIDGQKQATDPWCIGSGKGEWAEGGVESHVLLLGVSPFCEPRNYYLSTRLNRFNRVLDYGWESFPVMLLV